MLQIACQLNSPTYGGLLSRYFFQKKTALLTQKATQPDLTNHYLRPFNILFTNPLQLRDSYAVQRLDTVPYILVRLVL